MTNENNTLSKSAQRIQHALSERGLSLEVIELSSSTRTAQDAANTIGCEIGQIIKSLMFCTSVTKQPVLVLASGANRVKEKIIKRQIGEKVEKANADFTRQVTGFAIGGIPPIGHKEVIEHLYIDEDLLQHETLWAAAGTPFAVFSLRSGDIRSLTHGKVISIK